MTGEGKRWGWWNRLAEVCLYLSVLPAVRLLPDASAMHVIGCFKNQLSKVSQCDSTWMQKTQIKAPHISNTSNTSQNCNEKDLTKESWVIRVILIFHCWTTDISEVKAADYSLGWILDNMTELVCGFQQICVQSQCLGSSTKNHQGLSMILIFCLDLSSVLISVQLVVK